MLTMDDIIKYVMKNGFKRSLRDFPNYYWSQGIQYAYRIEPERWKPYIKMAKEQIAKNDYGGYYEISETPLEGREYYICKSPLGNDINTGIIAHKEEDIIVLYFNFER